MKSTYHPTNSETDWKLIELQCTAVTIALTVCMVISCFVLIKEMEIKNVDTYVPIHKLWALSSFRVATAFFVLIIPFVITGIASVYLQRKNPKND